MTDVAGVKVGNAETPDINTGVTVVLCQEPAVAGVHVMGGAPGTRETDLLAPEQTVQTVDAVVLSGGSAFGLDAASAVTTALAASGRGFAVGPARVPIVPAAILFDLLNGGNKAWGPQPPYAELGRMALAAADDEFAFGTAGAGTGASTANLKGGLGTASAVLASGFTVGALVAVNALGSATIGTGPHFWAAPFEEGTEFGGLGLPAPFPRAAIEPRTKLDALERGNTTIAVVATDAILTKAEAKRMAIAAHDGLARALWPAHTPLDGDLVFALATGKRPLADPLGDAMALGIAAAATLARAVARGVFAATPAENDLLPAWSSRFGGR